MDPTPECEFVSDDLVVKLDLTMPGDAGSITPIVDAVLQAVTESGCAEGAEHDIELALREALANAVRHGTKNDPGKTITCTVACDVTRGMLIVVRDTGEGFDPHRIPDCLMGENLYAHHGRGIYLINQLMDEVRFERGGTEIHMVKRLGSGVSRAPRRGEPASGSV
jgi:serine/threonine-protein kinase RsbW